MEKEFASCVNENVTNFESNCAQSNFERNDRKNVDGEKSKTDGGKCADKIGGVKQKTYFGNDSGSGRRKGGDDECSNKKGSRGLGASVGGSSVSGRSGGRKGSVEHGGGSRSGSNKGSVSGSGSGGKKGNNWGNDSGGSRSGSSGKKGISGGSGGNKGSGKRNKTGGKKENGAGRGNGDEKGSDGGSGSGLKKTSDKEGRSEIEISVADFSCSNTRPNSPCKEDTSDEGWTVVERNKNKPSRGSSDRVKGEYTVCRDFFHGPSCARTLTEKNSFKFGKRKKEKNFLVIIILV